MRKIFLQFTGVLMTIFLVSCVQQEQVDPIITGIQENTCLLKKAYTYNGFTFVYDFEHDEQDRLIRRNEYNSENELTSYTTYAYEDNQVIYRTFKTKDDTPEVPITTTIYTINANGFVTKMESNRRVYTASSDSYHREEFYFYNDDGYLIKRTTRQESTAPDAPGAIVFAREYQYEYVDDVRTKMTLKLVTFLDDKIVGTSEEVVTYEYYDQANYKTTVLFTYGKLQEKLLKKEVSKGTDSHNNSHTNIIEYAYEMNDQQYLTKYTRSFNNEHTSSNGITQTSQTSDTQTREYACK